MTRMQRLRKRQREARIRAAIVASLLLLAIAVIFSVRAVAENAKQEQEIAAKIEVLDTADSEKAGYEQETEAEDQMENEHINEALAEEKYISDEIPLSVEEQLMARAYCEEYNVPFSIALSVMEAESSFQNTEHDGICVGYMSIHRMNEEWLHRELGITDLLDPLQNIRAGIYILGKHYEAEKDWNRALTCYNYGPGGAYTEVFNNGYDSSDYSRWVLSLREKWQGVILDG